MKTKSIKHKLSISAGRIGHRFPLILMRGCWFNNDLKHVTGVEFLGLGLHISIGFTGGQCYEPVIPRFGCDYKALAMALFRALEFWSNLRDYVPGDWEVEELQKLLWQARQALGLPQVQIKVEED